VDAGSTGAAPRCGAAARPGGAGPRGGAAAGAHNCQALGLRVSGFRTHYATAWTAPALVQWARARFSQCTQKQRADEDVSTFPGWGSTMLERGGKGYDEMIPPLDAGHLQSDGARCRNAGRSSSCAAARGSQPQLRRRLPAPRVDAAGRGTCVAGAQSDCSSCLSWFDLLTKSPH
jgi:hypothetical protein